MSMSESDDAPLPTIELSLEGVLAFALRAEVDASQFYEQASAAVSDATAHNLLRDLAAEEKGHHATLAKLYQERFPEQWAQAALRSRANLVTGVPKHPPVRVVAPLRPIELLTIARWEENKARRLYEAGAMAAHGLPAVAAVLSRLALEEAGHSSRLDELATRLGLT